MKNATIFTLLLVPHAAAAQSLQVFLVNTGNFLNTTVIPFLFGIAFLFFIINVFRFFILGGSNQESQEKARALATYSVLGIVFLVIFWGVVNMLSSSIGLQDPCVTEYTSDYVNQNNPDSIGTPCAGIPYYPTGGSGPQ